MLIDWFTIAAQIINFLVLAYLLQRFLYGPIVAAMDAREQGIRARLQDADRRQADADTLAADCQQQRRDLDQRRDQLLADARREADAQREALVKAARADVATLAANWRAAVIRDQDAFLQALRRRAASQVVDVARRVLDDLADAELERRVVEMFIERLARLDPERRAGLAQALAQPAARALIRAAFPLAADQLAQIRAALRDLSCREIELSSEQAPELICGISLIVGGHEVVWSIQSYLERFDEQVAQALATPASAPALRGPAQ